MTAWTKPLRERTPCTLAHHDHIRSTALFLLLPYAGLMPDGSDGWLELRNCTVCNSTLARPLPKETNR